MMIYRILIICHVLLSFCFATDAQINIQDIKSKYGVRAWLAEDRNSDIVIATLIFGKSGYAYDPHDKQGISQLATLILQQGPFEQQKSDYLGQIAALGAKVFFEVDHQNLYCKVQALAQNIEAAIALACKAILNPKLDTNTIEQVKKIQNSQRHSLDDSPSYLAKRLFFESSFANSNYANNQYGSQKTLDKISAEDLKSFFANTFNRVHFNINFAGNISKHAITNILDKYIIDFPLTVINVRKDPAYKFTSPFHNTIQNPQIPQNIVVFGSDAPPVNSKNFYHLVVLNYLFGGSSLESMLNSEIRVKKGYSYGIHTSLSSLNSKEGGVFFGYCSCSNPDDVINIIKDKINILKQNGISQAQLDKGKDYIKSMFLINLDSASAISDFITYMQSNRLQINYINQYLENISDLNLASVNQFASSFFDTKRFNFIKISQS